jgi:hypothetical protein
MRTFCETWICRRICAPIEMLKASGADRYCGPLSNLQEDSITPWRVNAFEFGMINPAKLWR